MQSEIDHLQKISDLTVQTGSEYQDRSKDRRYFIIPLKKRRENYMIGYKP
jgi:hypothetical protein